MAAPAASTLSSAGAIEVGATGRPLPAEAPRERRLRVAIERAFPGRWIGIPVGAEMRFPSTSRGFGLFLSALFAPFIRTPIPALMYPTIYPQELPYYGLDAGLDFIGLGHMPRDNIYVHHRLWPQIEGGTIMAPPQFSFYSQVGLGGSLLFSMAVGVLLALLWRSLSAIRGSTQLRSVGAGLVLVLAILLAGDSVRNCLAASYGVLWGLLYLPALALIGFRPGARAGSKTSASG